jgi:hypothetical protein
MSAKISDSIFKAEQNIRWGLLPDRPDILYKYLTDCEALASAFDKLDAKGLFERTIDTLVEVICDPCVPLHWRCLCLDNLYRPIGCLRRVQVSDDSRRKLNKKMHDINMLAKYFLTH